MGLKDKAVVITRREDESEPAAPGRAVYVSAGKDRFTEDSHKLWGLIPLTTKVSSNDTEGALYLFEHTDMGKGGPPRHVHYEQDEWFYVIKGEFLVEVGGELFPLSPGDSLFVPRKVPHAWAHIGEEPGTLLTLVTPAGTFETFFQEAVMAAKLPTPAEMEKAFAAHEMKIVGPPLSVK